MSPDRKIGGAAQNPALKIGLIGAPNSGKLTFLSALTTAFVSRGAPKGWVVNPERDALAFDESAKEILALQSFPSRTEVENSEKLWLRFGFSWEKKGEPSRTFVVEILNRPGQAFSRRSPEGKAVAEELARCDGYLLLIDPLRERWLGDNSDYFSHLPARIVDSSTDMTMSELRKRALAVCVSKYDDAQVFPPSLSGNYGTQRTTAPKFPTVESADAKGYFAWACAYFADHSARPGNDSAERLHHQIERMFDPDLTAYFVTSSVGFRRSPKGFDLKEFVNVQGSRILSSVNPINVLEPIIRLAELSGRLS
ncbi:hypothetical protein GCM10009555_087920 [Acrocarpospora macrocephala]|uniref:Double-GTPase 2 domain-containing protein n=1 Tax=Acrocarpospora macrocephala TaxID=150177 RepID=A0A5M3WI22_9ACTN|nr:hypothetical protein [Acrocarpospora macrocephala]GES08775.1 hypothetical protein Amac_023710 [Acrocarpospora macrocephala]